MERPQRLLLAGAMLGLAGCTSLPQAPVTSGETVVSEPVTAERPPRDELPDVELDANLFFKLLVAEFALQEGQLGLAADAYLQSAEETRDPRLARRATQAAVYARNTGAALRASNLWVELQPNSIDARQSLSALLLRSGRGDEALPHLRKIIAFSPTGKPGHGYELVGGLLAGSEEPQQALRHMAQLTADAPDNPQALLAHAELAHNAGDNELATVLLERLLSQHPEHSQALLLQARIRHAGGQSEAALASLKKALSQQPDNDTMRLTYARMLVDAQQLAEARRQFRILNQRLPENSDVIYALGLLALEAEDSEDAEPYFMDLVRMGERSDEARFALGQIAQVRQRTQEAIDWFQSVPPGPRYMDAQLLAAQLIAREHGVDSALEYLGQLPLEEPDERIRRSMLMAELLSETERHEQAQELLNAALNDYPDEPQLLYARAMLAEKLGRLDLLEQDLKRMLELDPDSVQALNALGYTLADRTDRHTEALDYIERALELRPDDPAILDSMGWVLYRLNRFEESIDYLQRAAEGLPGDPEVAAHLGEVLWVSGKQEQAKRIWQEAHERHPDHDVLNATIERFAP